ncbi:MAG: CocE/NonD family hydrolase, partial [Microcystaceae cyanobacterium]
MLKIKQETISIFTKDNIRLDADLYRPETTERLPILLMRQPYGRKIASTVVYAHPRWYAAQGYIVIIQDVRGRGTSEGNSKLFETEIIDSLETLNWLAELPNSTGEVGMYGFSYQGMTQLYAAASKATNLKTICPAMIAYNLYQDWSYENGAFCLQNNLGWAIQLAAESAKNEGNQDKFQKLYQASRNLPLDHIIPAIHEILEQLAKDSFYFDWLNEPENSPYWQNLSPQYLLADLDLPMLHIGGWFDPHLRGNLKLYEAMASQCQSPQFLTIGPWGHLPWGQRLASQNYGDRATSEIDQLQIAWFDHFLKNKQSNLFTKSGCQLFEMGSNKWQYFADFTPTNYQTYYLQSTGLAAVNEQDGKLLTSLAE